MSAQKTMATDSQWLTGEITLVLVSNANQVYLDSPAQRAKTNIF